MNYLSTSEAAKELEVSKTRIILLIQAGRLKASRLGNVYAIDRRDLEAFKSLPRNPKGGRPKSK